MQQKHGSWPGESESPKRGVKSLSHVEVHTYRPELVKKQTQEHQWAISASSSGPSTSPGTSSRPSKRARVVNESQGDHVAAQSTFGVTKLAGRVTRSGSQRATAATAKMEGDSIVLDSESDGDDAYHQPESSGSVQMMPSQQSRENGKDYRSMQGEYQVV